MDMRIMLRPCPFCGGKADLKEVREGEDSITYYVACTKCDTVVGMHDAEPDSDRAMDKWQRRVRMM